MSGETEQNISGWTVDTLHNHLFALLAEKDARYAQRFDAQQQALRDALTAQEKAVNAALTAAQQAVQKAEMAAEKRFDAVNEFRGQLADQAKEFLPRNEYSVAHTALNEKVSTLEARANQMTGRTSGMSDGWGYIIGAIGALAAVVAIVVAVVSSI